MLINHNRQSIKGFTLVELSIVIVIIGFIVTGVTAGQSLVASSKVRAQVSDLQMYASAFNAFRTQYDAIAGDMADASTFWPGVTNGNGNGKNDIYADEGDATGIAGERYTLFQHLASAKLIPIPYNNTYELGVGYPALKINNTKGMMSARGIESSSDGGFNYQLSIAEVTTTVKQALFLNIGDPSSTGTDFDDSANYTLTSVQARAIDKKIDDGSARNGNFKAYSSYNGWTDSDDYKCLASNDGDYETANTQGRCMGEYILLK